MPDYDSEMNGCLFKNGRKTKETHPDYKGECQIGGVGMWVSGWLKTAKSGEKYMSLAFTAKDTPAAKTPTPTAPAADEPF